MVSRISHALIAAICIAAAFQTASAADFPDGATTPTADEIKQRLAGNDFHLNYANGVNVQLQFNRNGHFFVNASTNYSDNGEWTAEDGKLCTRSQKQGANCFPVRISADSMYLQRASGEIVRYEPR